jgi:hypothetical protein
LSKATSFVPVSLRKLVIYPKNPHPPKKIVKSQELQEPGVAECGEAVGTKKFQIGKRWNQESGVSVKQIWVIPHGRVSGCGLALDSDVSPF